MPNAQRGVELVHVQHLSQLGLVSDSTQVHATSLQSTGHTTPAGWAVLPTLDIDAVISSLELALRLPGPVCLDPCVAPSKGVVQCTYVSLFLPFQAEFRSCYFPAAAHRVQQFLACNLACHGLPIAISRQSGIPRSAVGDVTPVLIRLYGPVSTLS